MGRKKPAPQPLSLPDAGPSITASSTPDASRSHNGSALSSAGPEGSSSATATLSPSESRSPASATVPRSSPFSSRFAQKRPQTARPEQSSSKGADLELSEQRQRRPSQPFADNMAQSSGSYLRKTANSEAPAPTARSAHHETKKSKGGLFHFAKTSKSTNQFTSHSHQLSGSSGGGAQSKEDDRPGTSKHGTSRKGALDMSHPDTLHEKPNSLHLKTSRSELSLSSAGEREAESSSTGTKKSKPKTFGILTRTKSQRGKEIKSPHGAHDPMPSITTHSQTNMEGNSPPLRTAPVAHERPFREMMDSSNRNRSEDRAGRRGGASGREQVREREPKELRGLPSSIRETGGSTFLSGLRNSSTKAAGMFGSRLFGRGNRSASTQEREPVVDDEHYELKVLNLPLAAQTRRTRISRRLEDSKDKTEFWMPAFPWRAIDYLNYKGCEVEGLYRVPGSGPQIKKWQRKFDEEHDVNLFEEDDLYDINIIGSMLKAWLRELPDELFPKAAQERIARECAGSETVPQLLIDELSNLSPFQYYLLFAITCHLSLLLAHSDKNKMDFRNLCICFQPCMKIDAFCFRFLVCNWRDCWKGCKNEAAYIEQEYALLEQPPPRGLAESTAPTPSPNVQSDRRDEPSRPQSPDNRSNHSDQSESSAGFRAAVSAKGRLQESRSKNSVESHDSTISSTLTTDSEREPPRVVKDLRRLSPIQPLSPLGFQ